MPSDQSSSLYLTETLVAIALTNILQIDELNKHVDIMHQREAKLLERVEVWFADASVI